MPFPGPCRVLPAGWRHAGRPSRRGCSSPFCSLGSLPHSLAIAQLYPTTTPGRGSVAAGGRACRTDGAPVGRLVTNCLAFWSLARADPRRVTVTLYFVSALVLALPSSGTGLRLRGPNGPGGAGICSSPRCCTCRPSCSSWRSTRRPSESPRRGTRCARAAVDGRMNTSRPLGPVNSPNTDAAAWPQPRALVGVGLTAVLGVGLTMWLLRLAVGNPTANLPVLGTVPAFTLTADDGRRVSS